LSKIRFNAISENYKCITTELRENLEYLLTFIDLHINAPDINFVNIRPVSTESYPLIPIKEIDRTELEFIRGCLNTYLYLVFERLKMNSYASKFTQIINENDHILTFNYDLILEESLYNCNLWSPLNGYEGVNEFEYEKDKEYLIKENKFSKIKIHKLHGSINWISSQLPSTFPNSKEILIKLDNLETQNFFFNNVLVREPNKSGGYYVGAQGAYWLLPSYIKLFDTIELVNIWKSAFKIISETSDLIIIGYSFREEDSNALLLLSNLPSNSTITIVDKNPKPISEKIKSLGFEKINIFYSAEEYIDVN